MPPALAGVKRLRKDCPNITSSVRPNARSTLTAPIRLMLPPTYEPTISTSIQGRLDQSADFIVSQMSCQSLRSEIR